MASKISTFKPFSSRIFTVFALFIALTARISAQDHNEHHEATVAHDSIGAVDSMAVTTAALMDAAASHHEAKEEAVDITKVAFEHILDSHSWHLWGEGHDAVAIPLPVIVKGNNGFTFFMSSAFHHDVHGMNVVEVNGDRFVNFEEKIYLASDVANEHGQFLTFNEEGEVANASALDLSITKNVTQMFISVIVLVLLFSSIAKSYKSHGVTSAPRGKQSFFEPLIVFVRDDIAKGNIGPKYEKFVPYLLTVFFMILINNVFGLIPIGANLTGNIAFTLVLSVCTLIITNINGNGAYWHHILLPPAPKWLYPILIPIEVVGIFTKPFALMIRLFANITAGHIIVISLVGLIFVFKTIYISPVSVAFALFIDVLECLVAFLQAYIFTMLTALFIGSAVAEHHHEEAHGHTAEHH